MKMNGKRTAEIFLFGFTLLIFTLSVKAASFCVSSSAELQTALAVADSNNQADHIKLRFGVYTGPANGFVYSGLTENHDLEISGNWFTFNNDSCGSRILAGDPLGHSTLDGGNTASALNIIPGAVGDITISYVVFTGGNSDDFGGGLRLFPVTEYRGNVLIENNVFVDNKSEEAGAFYLGGGNRVVVRNNLFTENSSDNSDGSVVLWQESLAGIGASSGIYFTNNTVYGNSASIGHSTLFAGLSITVEGDSKAFLANNLIWANTDGNLRLNGTGYTYLFNNNFPHIPELILDVADEVSGNLSVVPVFEEGLLNFKPALNSALSNRGKRPPTLVHIPPHFDETWGLGTLDLSGEARVFGTSVDIGAIESDSLNDLIFADDFE